MTSLPRRGLYAIADTVWIEPRHMPAAIESVIDGGAVMIQLRDKQRSVRDDENLLQSIMTICRRQAVPFIINDDARLAARIGADGVHVGQGDDNVDAIRRELGSDAIIGVSCHGDLDSARRAAEAGADYVAFGRFFASQTKPDAPGAAMTTLQQARAELDIPVVAIGGITPDNAARLLAAGADLLAVIAGVFASDDIRASAAAYRRLFQQSA